MKALRSASQILFGFLPGQTVDLQGRIWKVRSWRRPLRENVVDVRTLRRELLRQAAPWKTAGQDGGYSRDIERGYRVYVYTLDRHAGIDVDPFPEQWVCKVCQRVLRNSQQACPCGAHIAPGQLHFVGYCDACGALREPYIKTCPEHKAIRIVWPGTASAREIRFECPRCHRTTQKGFGSPNCSCGRGTIKFSVHRAASVFTPRGVVIVNPPSQEKINHIAEAGGPPRALLWVVNGMQSASVFDAPASVEAIRRQLKDSGLDDDVIERMLQSVDAKKPPAGQLEALRLANPAEAEDQAVSIALATSESRRTLADLQSAGASSDDLRELYQSRYPAALTTAGLESVDLVDKFPVLTGMFGYTRGDPLQGKSRLVPFRLDRNYAVYADLSETEALFFRLDPKRVTRWLRIRGYEVPVTGTPAEQRAELLGAALGDGERAAAIAANLFELVHSYCHRLIRLTSVFGGVDRNALSELVTPLHLGFFVYAAARGDFVLGGLQALYENELDQLLTVFSQDDHRCPLDPGCTHGGGACMACLHLGEPSCRHFNAGLSRSTLTGASGYLGLDDSG